MLPSTNPETETGIPVEDLELLMRSELMRATPDSAKKRLMKSMNRVLVRAGERIISQGDEGDCFYLVQDGFCMVTLDKNGETHPLTMLKPGDILGELAVLTGEARSANVDAETDMALWRVSREAFADISRNYPELREFLTEIATERLCSRKITAERTVGRYKIIEIVEEGGWSIVYKGVHSELNLPVAIKMLKHNLAMDSDFFERFQNEAKVIASLNHDNIVKVYDIEHVYTTVFIIMEYLDGLTIRRILDKERALPLPRVIRILAQVCSALHYAHQQGIVHLDVKPGNIFVQNDGRVKVVDFGLASPIGVCAQGHHGSPFYMAPEQIEGEAVDPRTDVYSLGITAYEMATGTRPYSDDVCEVLRSHITEPMPDPRRVNPELPEGFSRFVLKAAGKDPAERHQTMTEVMAELAQLTQSLPPDAGAQTVKKLRNRRLFLSYDDGRGQEVNQLLAEFTAKLRRLGVDLSAADEEGDG
jgi:tRNA A-37 threonylcarbamoyl transferase component Bud32